MVDSLHELKPGVIVFAGANHFKIHRVSKAKPGAVQSKEGGCFFEECSVKTVPPTFTRGELRKDSYNDLTLRRFISGNAEGWERWMKDECRWGNVVDVTYAAVGDGEPVARLVADLKGVTKLDLIAYLIRVHGPSLKDDLLRMAAAIEGNPWVPTSNQEYFSNVRDYRSPTPYGGDTKATMKMVGKLGRKNLYGLGPDGEERAKEVLRRLGEGPAMAAK